MKNKKINLDAFIWTSILCLYAYMIFDLIRTGDILLYLHPKMLVYVYFAFAFICILVVYQITRLFQLKTTQKLKKGYLLFLVPLILAFAVDPQGVSIQMAENKGVYVVNDLKKEDVGSIEAYEKALKVNEKDTPYYINDFASTLMDMYIFPEKYDGKSVQVMGFLYKEDAYETNSFLVARLLMNCCAADAQVAGIKCEWDQMDQLNFENWYLIEGKIKLILQYSDILKRDEQIAVIEVTKATAVSEPINPYIYP